jgi:hypothetical protein
MTQPDGEDPLSLDMLTAALRADSNDVKIYARVLTESLSQALPPDCVSVERDRSMSDKMRGRPGEVSKITVRLGDQVLTLTARGAQTTAEVCREVRGVVLSRDRVPLHDWARVLAAALVTHAENNAQAAEALRRMVTGT